VPGDMRVFFFFMDEFAALKMLRNAGAARRSDRKPELRGVLA
jgi:hypothetical protein